MNAQAERFEATVDELLGSLNEVERKNSPNRLYCIGDRRLFKLGPRISVVGSRTATDEGARRARKLARALVSGGAIVVSGLAEGIDTAAHTSAIEAGGRTIAVLGSSLEVPYPASNRSLFEQIAQEHLVVTQFASGMPVQAKNFPMRNRTMALLSHATVIVEAGERSGTLHQAWEALRLGRSLFLLESVARNPSLSWPAEVMKYGAQVLSDSNLQQLFDQLPTSLEEAIAF